MRLLHTRKLKFERFATEQERPRYAILSHRWHQYEPTQQDIEANRGRAKQKSDCSKIFNFAQYTNQNLPHLSWLWVDSCCIAQKNAAEVSESVNLMFDFYRAADICIAYLPDVDHPDDYMALQRSVWFTRGWTLQELLASRSILFLTNKWQVIGHKGYCTHLQLNPGPNLEQLISKITNIPQNVLQDFNNSYALSITQRLSWMRERRTLIEEDRVYALFGIFGVRPNARYGETYVRAERRLLEAISEKERLSRPQHQTLAKALNDILKPLTENELRARQALDTTMRQYGEDNKRTWQAMLDLAAAYIKQNRLGQAAELTLSALERRRRYLGESHRDTLQAMFFLATIYERLGRHTEADALRTRILK